MKEIREAAESEPELVNEVTNCVKPLKLLINDVMHRLQLKDKKFKTFNAATEEDMALLWDELAVIDPTVSRTDTTQ